MFIRMFCKNRSNCRSTFLIILNYNVKLNYRFGLQKALICRPALICSRAASNGHGQLQGTRLEFAQFGDPVKVLRASQFEIAKLKPTQVLLKMVAAPINPADINLISGVYGVKPPLPAVPGHEGLAKIVQVGTEVVNFKENDHAVPIRREWGTWTTHQVCEAKDLLKIPEDVPVETATSIVTNPLTAYRMLVDFTRLDKGDSVIQNGANSSVGQAVIQIARNMGFRTVNIVRSRPDIDELKERLHSLGADYVLTEEEIRTNALEKIWDEIPPPKLALNCVGGRAASSLFKWMQDNGKMVTYGGMSLQPIPLPAGPLIFKNVSVHGFWCRTWLHDESNVREASSTINNIFQMVREGKFKAPPSNLVPFSEFQTAISNAIKPYGGRKQVLVM